MKQSRRLFRWEKGLSWLMEALAFASCVCLALTVLATFQAEAARPGKNDPLAKPGRRSLFPDHEILTFLPADGNFTPASYVLDQDLSLFSPIAAHPSFAPSTPQTAAVAGRIVAEEKDQVVYALRGGDRVQVFLLQPTSSETVHSASLPSFAAPPANSTEFLDLAVGDLDNLPDAQGRNHDEVVVCYATTTPEAGQLAVMVGVLDYTDRSASKPLIKRVKSSTRIDATSFASDTPGKIQPADSVVACAVGDLNGDGQNEIVVAHLENADRLWLSVFRYLKNQTGVPTLKEVSKTPKEFSKPGLDLTGTLDLVVADFNGDGRDDLALAYYLWVPGRYDLEENIECVVELYSSDQQFGLQYAGRTWVDFRTPTAPTIRIQAAAGLFKFDPEAGFDFGRRQLAVIIPAPGSGGLILLTLIPSDDLKPTGKQIFSLYDWIQNPTSPAEAAHNRFALAAGNFRGWVPDSKPLWSIVVGSWNDDGIYRLTAVRVNPDDGSFSIARRQEVSGPATPVIDAVRTALVAYDHDGDTVYLGAPAHITLTGMARTDFIVEEPPKHLAYLNGGIVNVSRRPDFYVELLDGNSESFTSRSTDTTAFGFGASLQVSAKATVSAQRDIGIARVGGQASVEATAKAGYDYAEHREGYNDSYIERTLEFTGQTKTDDLLVTQLQLFDIWRYRAYGVKTAKQDGNETYAFYELVMPGPRMTARGGGLTFDWYQPVHENGNILSYPKLTGSSAKPVDLGSFRLPGGETINEPLIPPQLYNYDGTSGKMGLIFSEESGGGSAREYSHALSSSLDVGVSGKASAKAFGAGASTEWSVNASLTGNKSWGNLATSGSTSSTSTGITLYKPYNGDSTRYYPFAPLAYITRDGTFKVTHTVGELNGTDSWWQDKFGSKPDPALNLPRRFIETLDGDWKPNSRDSRKRMRGFFVCQPADLASAACEELSRQPSEGEVVRLLARVHNYSTAKTARDLIVRFEAVAYDDATNKEVGERKVLGRTKIASLAPRQMKQASFNWNTSGFGPGTGTGLARYRIYVVLDPQNSIKEICETEPKGTINPGQNNEGWGMISVTAPPAASTPAAESAVLSRGIPATKAGRKVDGIMATEEPGGMGKYGSVIATVGEPLSLRVHVSSLHDDSSNHRLLVFAQPPGEPERSEVVAGKLIQGLDAQNGAYVWTEWTPNQVGEVELRAVLAEFTLEQGEVPDAARLMVRVIRPDTK